MLQAFCRGINPYRRNNRGVRVYKKFDCTGTWRDDDTGEDAYIERRLQEGKTRREANRCLKRYLARSLYRLLEHGAPPAT